MGIPRKTNINMVRIQIFCVFVLFHRQKIFHNTFRCNHDEHLHIVRWAYTQVGLYLRGGGGLYMEVYGITQLIEELFCMGRSYVGNYE